MVGYKKLTIPVEVVSVPIITLTSTEINTSTGSPITLDVKVDGIPMDNADLILSTEDSSVVLITPVTQEIIAGNVGNTTIKVEYKKAKPVIINVSVTE